MGLNVSTTMGFENRNFLRNAAREILQISGASHEASSKIIDTAIFDKKYVNSQTDVFQASAQISFSKSLNETLKYLKSHATKKEVKTPKFGELWDSLSSAKNDSKDCELFEFVLDDDAENIFAAA